MKTENGADKVEEHDERGEEEEEDDDDDDEEERRWLRSRRAYQRSRARGALPGFSYWVFVVVVFFYSIPLFSLWGGAPLAAFAVPPFFERWVHRDEAAPRLPQTRYNPAKPNKTQ